MHTGIIALSAPSFYLLSRLRPCFFVLIFMCSDAMASVESVKAASDVYAPLSGKVTHVNDSLRDNPALVNQSPEADAWFVKLELEASAEAEAKGMLDGAAYKKHCDEAGDHH